MDFRRVGIFSGLSARQALADCRGRSRQSRQRRVRGRWRVPCTGKREFRARSFESFGERAIKTHSQRREGAKAAVRGEHVLAEQHRIIRESAARGAAQPRRHPQSAHADERDLLGRDRRAARRSRASSRARRRDTRSADRNEMRRDSRRPARVRAAAIRADGRRGPMLARLRRRGRATASMRPARDRADRASSRFSISSVLVLSSRVRFSRAAKNSTRSRLMPVSESNASESASSPVPTRKCARVRVCAEPSSSSNESV